MPLPALAAVLAGAVGRAAIKGVLGGAVRSGLGGLVRRKAAGLVGRTASRAFGKKVGKQALKGAIRRVAAPDDDKDRRRKRAWSEPESLSKRIRAMVTGRNEPAAGGASPSRAGTSAWPLGSSPQPLPPAQPQQREEAASPVRSFASTVTKGGNFGNLLSGKTTPGQAADAESKSQEDAAKQEKDADAKEKAAAALKTFAVAATGSVAAMVAIPVASKKFAEALAASREGLSKYNSGIAIAFARLNSNRLLRERGSASNTQDSTIALAKAVDDMEEAMRPMKDSISNLANRAGAWLAGLAAEAARLAEEVAKAAGIMAELTEEEKKKKKVSGIWIDFLRETSEAGAKRRLELLKPLPKRK